MTTDDDAATVDARGLRCPLPVLKARKAIKDLAPGALLTVLATDPAAPLDFEHFCATQGHEMVASRHDGDTLIFEIRRGV
ncbi:MAG: sulfurtransferase TusA family protein [Alphaproteobacteria bacterium]|nr:sulfurtransferase TusA family protein [Alphaproteobacteria bacterium]MEC8117299.1 sulfurtransferase TusA family protein [Pseudomonadota bacterium]MEC8182566.1 sulfurtransferase TusA family protein [Pseudomonadota bacterium]MEC8674784.1 sulfurtransferase TusA family protein [Pseudomonadota bacterium]MED5365103.1 sulfurtransferase TusA family protein [Pseudomonadota bacterium]